MNLYLRKMTVVIITALMLCVSFTIVSTDDAEALDFIDAFPGFPDGTFAPADICWNDAGTVAMAVGTGSFGNVWVYDIYQPLSWLGPFGGVVEPTQVLTGVSYDSVNQLFWFCGDLTGAPSSTVYYWDPPFGLDGANYLVGGSGPLLISVLDVATDGLGNPCAVGYSTAHYFDGANWVVLTGTGTSEEYHAIDYNTNDDRFYFGGYFQPGRGSSLDGKFYYTDTLPRLACYQVASYAGTEFGAVYDIAWNQMHDYGLVVGETIMKVEGTAPTYIWNDIKGIEFVESMETFYKGISWDTSGWNEAAIVGNQYQSGAGYRGTYWRFYGGTNDLLRMHVDDSASEYTCVGFKPPASPKFVLIPLAGGGGGVKINVFMLDQTTQVRINSAFPHIFDLDMWDQADPGQNTLLKTEVDVLNDYTFYLEWNYSIGGVDHSADAEFELTAWFDGGQVAGLSTPLDGSWSTEDHRTREFRLFYTAFNDTVWWAYPMGFPFEFSYHSHYLDPTPIPATDHYMLYLNVTFEQQTYAADGNLFITPSTGFLNYGDSLVNPNSWDFNYSVYDRFYPSAREEAYEEFGVKEAVAIVAAGNPTGNAPPGSAGVPLNPVSTITYSSNTPYWVNVSIPDLYLNGIPGPTFIPAVNIGIMNLHSNASSLNSDIGPNAPPTGRKFTAPGAPWSVWGNRTLFTTMPIPLNGTQAAGEWHTDYTEAAYPGNSLTTVRWWADVPAIPEGVYWATITFSIQDTP